MLMVNQYVNVISEKLNALQKRHGFYKPQMMLENWEDKLIEKYQQLKHYFNNHMQLKINQLLSLSTKINLLNPDAQLKRGYALAIDKNKKVIYESRQIEIDDLFHLRIAKGELIAKVMDKGNKNG